MNVLVKTRLRLFMHRIFRQDKYDESDFESDASIHYAEIHGADYHENDKTKIKIKIKKQIKKKKDKTIVDEKLKKLVRQYLKKVIKNNNNENTNVFTKERE